MSQSNQLTPNVLPNDPSSAFSRLAFIGGGHMAQAMIGGLLAQGYAPERIVVSDPSVHVKLVLESQGIKVVDHNQKAVEMADVIIIAVKPQLLTTALADLTFDTEHQLILSVVAGAPIALIRQLLGGYERIVRVMPNTPALVQQGAYGVYAAADLKDQVIAIVEQILSATGLVMWVDEELKIDAVTALSGSGPAYFFYLMEAMIQAGKNLGLDELTAHALTLQTALGAAQMAIQSEHGPAQLRRQVTSPNGTTQAAMETFDHYQVSQHIQAALAAAQKRSQVLGEELLQSIQVGS